jgi:cell division septal protein FtsQ
MIRNGPLEPREGARRPSRWWPFRRRPANRRLKQGRSPVANDERTAKVKGRAWQGVKLAARLCGALAAAAAVTGGLWALHRWATRSPQFAIREVRVSPTMHVTADSLRARAGIELGDNLFSVDLEATARELQAEPWVQSAKVRRELPAVIAIEVVERQPACLLAFGGLYLADARGEAFKRASPSEAAGLPVVTGVPRDLYVDDRETATAEVREALAALAVWRERPARGAAGEVHVDAADGVTIYAARDGAAVRIGRAEAPAAWRERLARYDAVAKALAESGERARVVMVDRARADRVTVRLAGKKENKIN